MPISRSIHVLPIIGGHIALDFVNTLGDYYAEAPIEHLKDYPVFLAWARRVNLLPAGELSRILKIAKTRRREAGLVLDEIMALRACLHEILIDRHSGRPSGQRRIQVLRHAFAEAVAEARLSYGKDGSFTLIPGNNLRAPLQAICLHSATFLTSPLSWEMKLCARGPCGWFFLDNSRKHNRRWCSMQDCGNLMKQRRFRKLRASA